MTANEIKILSDDELDRQISRVAQLVSDGEGSGTADVFLLKRLKSEADRRISLFKGR